ncbi:MAG TPA: TonB-dependent receptor [Verrucomicrobiae bacterium]|nr:TonB-dependent receptor [Verrucomicrobiae bacterium]
MSLALIGVAGAPLDSTNASGTLSDLDELINLRVTSVSKKQTLVEDSPAAVTVVTGEDIRRLGITTLPEALRLAPGMDVARISGNQWAVSSRGFNDEFTATLLVMIDGRSVYTPDSGGVFWNAQNVVMEDVERIEVVRGPGATLWGANAVNGVINIVTKSAADTQGGLITASVGSEDHPAATIRYGGEWVTNLYYRVYLTYFDRDGLVQTDGRNSDDDWDSWRGGFRMDWEPTSENTLTWQGDYYADETRQPVDQESLAPLRLTAGTYVAENTGFNTLGRWTHQFSDTAESSVQAYYDHFAQGAGVGVERQDTYDAEAECRFSLGNWNDIVSGAGYRYADVHHESDFRLSWLEARQRLSLANVFAQDEMTLAPETLRLTVGTKCEHNNLTGWELEPSARLLWRLTERQTLWAAVSRAARTPSWEERDGRYNSTVFHAGGSPGLVTVFGNSTIGAENLTAYEVGYRTAPLPHLSFDATAFYNLYDHFIVAEPNPTRVELSPAPAHTLVSSTWKNDARAQTYGVEISGEWRVTDAWRLAGSYSWLHLQTQPDSALTSESPAQQAQVRSYWDLPFHLELNAAASYVDQITSAGESGEISIPSYVRADLGMIWRPARAWEIGVWGQNLLQARHAEAAQHFARTIIEEPRSFLVKATWRF